MRERVQYKRVSVPYYQEGAGDLYALCFETGINCVFYHGSYAQSYLSGNFVKEGKEGTGERKEGRNASNSPISC